VANAAFDRVHLHNFGTPLIDVPDLQPLPQVKPTVSYVVGAAGQGWIWDVYYLARRSRPQQTLMLDTRERRLFCDFDRTRIGSAKRCGAPRA
jgi:hypothetical protein